MHHVVAVVLLPRLTVVSCPDLMTAEHWLHRWPNSYVYIATISPFLCHDVLQRIYFISTPRSFDAAVAFPTSALRVSLFSLDFSSYSLANDRTVQTFFCEVLELWLIPEYDTFERCKWIVCCGPRPKTSLLYILVELPSILLANPTFDIVIRETYGCMIIVLTNNLDLFCLA